MIAQKYFYRYFNRILFDIYYEGGEALEHVAQRSCGCPQPAGVQGEVGWGFEQPGLAEGVPVHGRGVGTR